MQECRVCHETKELDQFSISNTNKSGYRTICKPCASIKSSEYYTKNSGRIRQRVTAYSHGHIRLHERQLLSRLKFLCTKARGRKTWPVDIDIDHLEEVYNKQQGLCRYTGLPLILEANQSNTMSLDRIDSKLGYLKGNVQLVCAMVNRMKQEFSEVEFLKFCTLIADNLR